MRWLSRLLGGALGWLFTLVFTGLIIGAIAGFLVFEHYAKDLPDYSALATYDPPTVTRLYAGDGRLLAEYATEKRVFVPLSAMPRRVINAFISAEDKNFYQHTGVDLTGIGRAVYTNILNYGQNKSMVGGSTITQQVVKNFLLTDEKSFERKIKEAILALRITRAYSKDKILELYLNQIYLGLRSYGVAAAALNYYNKSLDELTVDEVALLAAMPKAPANYDPRRNHDAAKQRRDWVIKRMLEDGHITREEADAAIAAPIQLRVRAADDVAKAEFFAEEVRRWLVEHYGANVLYEGGLVVKTTLEPTLQKMAEQGLRQTLIDYDRRRGYRGALKHIGNLSAWQQELAAISKQDFHLLEGQKLAMVSALSDSRATIGFEDGSTGMIPMSLLKWTRRVVSDGVLGPEVRRPGDILKIGDVIMVGPLSDEQKKTLNAADAKQAWDLQQVPAVNGAMVALDPHTGRVLAMVGGYAYGGTEFNRATQAKRQPGSSFKPFVYMAGLENGFTPSTVILDAPVELSQGAGLPTWKPQNYHAEYLGPTTMRVGLEKSRNTMTVRLGQMIGIERVIEIGQRFGIYDNPPRNFSMVLGAAETTLTRMVNAYGMIVNGGKRITPALIERIDDRNGRIIYRRDTRDCASCQVADIESVARDVPPPIPADDREQIADPRVAYQLTSMLEGVVQRGTATRAKVIGKPLGGKTGTTNNSMDTWFVGFSPDLVAGVYVGYDKPQTLGKKETGSSVALPAFTSFMQSALADKPAVPFRIPRGVQLVRVDLQTGLPLTGAEENPKVIQEGFITGAPIFVPGVTRELSASSSTSGAGLTGADMQNGVVEIPQQPTAEDVQVITPSASPVVGTGGLY